MLGLAAGVLTAAGRHRTPRRWAVLLGANVLAAAMVPDLEYEAHASQFAVVWPITAFVVGAVLAFALSEQTHAPRQTVSYAAAVYTLRRLGVVAFPAVQGFSAGF